MARARFQEGTLLVVGKKYKVMYRAYGVDGNATRKKEDVGFVSQMSKREAKAKARDIVMKGTGQLPEAVTSEEMTLQRFYRDFFLPVKQSSWSEGHADSFKYVMDTHVLPKLGKYKLTEIDKRMPQAVLDSMCPKYTESTIDHVRRKMYEVFNEAVDMEYINRNPAKKARVPMNATPPDRPFLTQEQLMQLIGAITDRRDSALLHISAFCALRTSEIFGLAWKHFVKNDDGVCVFNVEQIAYRGKIRPRTKTRSSRAQVPVVGATLKRLLEWQAHCSDTSPEALVFPSTNKNGRSKKGAPMYPGTWLQKRIQPIAEQLGIPFKFNIRATRRTAATNLDRNKESLKTTQTLLRHSPSSNLAQNVYIQSVPEEVVRAVGDYQDRVYATKPKPKLTRVK